ncbi:hypothetical protein M758_3G161400 [Ceratodon purpureus]|nr:hypothetical protein M758_3G161400 [Ceratodon purpureus]
MKERWRSNGGAMVEQWWSDGGAMEEQWRSDGGAMVEQWRSDGGAMVERWRREESGVPDQFRNRNSPWLFFAGFFFEKHRKSSILSSHAGTPARDGTDVMASFKVEVLLLAPNDVSTFMKTCKI